MYLRHYVMAIVIFIGGMLLSLTAFYSYQANESQQARTEFERLIDLRLVRIEEIFIQTVQQLDYTRLLFYTSDQVSEEHFHTFTNYSLYLYPNLLILGWKNHDSVPLSLSKNPSIFLSFQFPFHVSKPFPLDYLTVSPFSSKPYWSLFHYHSFLSTFQLSQRSSVITLSSPIDYWDKGYKKGFFLFTPVYTHPEAILMNNNKKLQGTLVGFSDFESVINRARKETTERGFNFGIYQLTKEKKELLYWSQTTGLEDPHKLDSTQIRLKKEWSRARVFAIGDQLWEIEAVPTLNFISYHSKKYWMHWEIPIIGIFISGLTTFYFLVMINQRRLIEIEVKKRTHELAKINTLLNEEMAKKEEIESHLIHKQNYLKRHHEALEYLTKFTIAELPHALNEVLIRTISVMQIDRVSIWFYEKVNEISYLKCASSNFIPTPISQKVTEFNSSQYPIYFQSLEQHNSLILPSPIHLELNDELKNYLDMYRILSKLDIPILFEGNLLGVIFFEETRTPREWYLEDSHFGQTIADIVSIILEQSKRKKVEKKLYESEEKLRFVTQHAIDGIISISEQGQIISWNEGAKHIFGFKEEDILEKPLKWIIPNSDIFKEESVLKPIELQGKHFLGHLFPVEVSYTRWEKGNQLYDTIIVREITERKENERRLIKAMREARAANAAKSEFLAVISHELRTPLNAIIGFNQCLLMGLDGAVSAQQEASLKKIEKAASHLLTLINDILDLARIEANKMELEIISQNIVEIITACVDQLMPSAQKKSLTLQIELDKPFILLDIDKMRIKQVLLNLLSNAIKFTERGNITIHLQNFPNYVQIEVTDTGIGLSFEEISKIFRPFAQADSSITRKYGGTGLGLAISKKIIELHGGRMQVRSQKDKGSTFSFTLPKQMTSLGD